MRRREARAASVAAEIDAAARWVLVELRDHEVRWSSVHGSALPVPMSELRARVPHAILSDRAAWARVAARVRTDENVEVVPSGGYLEANGTPSKEEGWRYAPTSPLSPGAGFSPDGFSPKHRDRGRRASSPARRAA